MAELLGSSSAVLAGRHLPPGRRGEHPSGTGRAQIPCVYCRRGVEPSSFTFWSSMGVLLSATCTSCHRRMTMRRSTWILLSGSGGERNRG